MLEKYAETQPVLYQSLKKAIEYDKLSHAYLFEMTQDNDNDFAFIMDFVKEILTSSLDGQDKEIVKRRIDDHNYPELTIIEPINNVIKKEQLNDLQKNFSTKAIEGHYKIYIMKSCEKMNLYAANSILKFLEEPEPGILAILLTENKSLVLSTILSRCQCYSFQGTKQEKIYSENDEAVQKALRILKYIDDEAQPSLIYEKEIIPTKEDFYDMIEIMIAFYRCVYYNNFTLFSAYKDFIETVEVKKDPILLSGRMNQLLQYQNDLNYNVNINLLFDRMLMEMKDW